MLDGRKGGGDGREGADPVWFTMLWLDGRILSDGEFGTGGGGICWLDALLDVVART